MIRIGYLLLIFLVVAFTGCASPQAVYTADELPEPVDERIYECIYAVVLKDGRTVRFDEQCGQYAVSDTGSTFHAIIGREAGGNYVEIARRDILEVHTRSRSDTSLLVVGALVVLAAAAGFFAAIFLAM